MLFARAEKEFSLKMLVCSGYDKLLKHHGRESHQPPQRQQKANMPQLTAQRSHH
jgi:hypothetical protein